MRDLRSCTRSIAPFSRALRPVGLHAVELLARGGDLSAQRLQTLLAGRVLLLHEGLLLDLHLRELAVHGVDVGGHGVELHAQTARGLVNEVDGLVGQEPVGDVAVGEVCGADQRGVRDAHAVVLLVALLEPAQDGDRVLHGGLGDHHGLETAGERRVLLDVLAVLVQRGGADGVQVAAGEGRLQDVAGVHGALGGTRAHDGVQLVDEEDDLAVGVLDLLEHRLQAVLKLAAVLGAGHQGRHVQLHDVLVADGGRNVAVDDALGQALHDGGLAHARLADQHGVVLGAAAEHLDRAANLLDAADHRVELALARKVGDVAAVLLERLELGLGVLAGDVLAGTQLLVGLAHALAGDAGGLEDGAGLVLAVRERAEQVLRGDVGVAHLGRELLGRVAHAHEVLADAHLRRVAGDAWLTGDGLVHLRLDGRGVRAHALDDRAEVALAGAEQRLEQVHGLHLAGAGVRGNAHGGLQRFLGRDGPLVKSHGCPLWVVVSQRLLFPPELGLIRKSKCPYDRFSRRAARRCRACPENRTCGTAVMPRVRFSGRKPRNPQVVKRPARHSLDFQDAPRAERIAGEKYAGATPRPSRRCQGRRRAAGDA